MGFRLTHNGMDIKFFDTIKDCMDYVRELIYSHKDLNPTLVLDKTVKLKYNGTSKESRILVYEYYTLYREVFMIERK